MRHVIVHYHIFKNAGSTVDSVLKNNFGDRCGSIEGRNPWDTLCPDDILKYKEPRGQICFFNRIMQISISKINPYRFS